MARMERIGSVDARFSTEGAGPTTWAEVLDALENAQIFWISTVRPDGRPHVTPLIAVLVEESMYFCTGPDERKARNIEANPACALSTGRNEFDGLDVVIDGSAVRVTDDNRLHLLAQAYVDKYGEEWRFDVRGGAFLHSSGSIREEDRGQALVFGVVSTAVHAFAKGDRYSQTTWRF